MITRFPSLLGAQNVPRRHSGVSLRISRSTASQNSLRRTITVDACDSKQDASKDTDLTTLAITMWISLTSALPAGAEETVMYNAEKQGDFVKNAAGIGYTLLVGFFLARLFNRRSKFATEYRLSSTPEEKAEAAKRRRQTDRVTAPQALVSGVLAGVLSAALFYVATQVDGFFEAKELPSNYTARNITVTIETIVRGLVYLASFIFGANSFGLVGLSLRLLQDPELGDPDVPVVRELTPEEIKERELKKITASSSSVLNSPVVGFFTGIEKSNEEPTSVSSFASTSAPTSSSSSKSSSAPRPSVSPSSSSSEPAPTSGFLSFKRLDELNDPSLDLTERLVKKDKAEAKEGEKSSN